MDANLKDSRFLQSNAAYQTYMERRREAAQAWIDGAANEQQLKQLEDTIGLWWTRSYKILSRLSFEERNRTAWAEIREELLGIGGTPSPLVAALQTYFEDRNDSSEAKFAIAVFLARAVGRATATISPCDVVAFDTGVNFVSDGREVGFFDFIESFTEECRTTSALQLAWTRVFVDGVSSLDSLVSVIGRDRQVLESLRRQEEVYRRQGDPFSLWNSVRGDVPISSTFFARLLYLQYVDLNSICTALEAIPSNEVRESAIVYLDIHESPQLMKDLIKRSAPVIKDGDWTQNVLALHILDAGLNYSKNLSGVFENEVRASLAQDDAKKQLADFQNNESPKWLCEFYGLALERHDGLDLTIEFARHLVGEAQRDNTSEVWSASLDALGQICELLKERGVRPDDLFDRWMKRAGDYLKTSPITYQQHKSETSSMWHDKESPVPYIVLAAAIDEDESAQIETRTSNRESDPWYWYSRTLQRGDSEVISQVNPYGTVKGWLFRTLASSLLHREDPVGSWSDAWHELAWQRQMERFSYRAMDALASSQHLLRTGRFLLEVLIGANRYDEAMLLWKHLVDATYILVGGSGVSKLSLSTEVSILFAYVPFTFQEKWPEAVKAARPVIAVDQQTAVISAYNMFVQKSTTTLAALDIVEVFRTHGIDLASASTTLVQWKKLGGLGPRDNTTFDYETAVQVFSI